MKRALAVALLLLSACDPYALQRRQAALAAFVGGSEADLVRAMGVPSRTVDADGKRFLAYTESATYIDQPFTPWRGLGYRYYDGFELPAQVVQRVCETTFEVGEGRVLSYSLRGNACG